MLVFPAVAKVRLAGYGANVFCVWQNDKWWSSEHPYAQGKSLPAALAV